MLTGKFSWLSDNVVAILIAQGQYSPSINHQSMADIPVVARIATSGSLTGKTVSVNTVDAGNYLFTNITGPPIAAVVLAYSTGTDISSPLICYLDQVTGLPYVPSTGTVQVSWSAGTNGIFAL